MDIGMQPQSIGIIADSHSQNARIRNAIDALRSMGAEYIVHLGDICDSLKPETLPEALAILNGHGVKGVLGNNEYSLLTETYNGSLDPDSRMHIKGLPYTLTIEDWCFTHSVPFPWPAATRRPLQEFLPFMHTLPYRIVFRGHSHTPAIAEISPAGTWDIEAPAQGSIALDPHKSYVITVGALENGAYTFFDTVAYKLHFLTLSY
jgi:predicted phosphodiesterase